MSFGALSANAIRALNQGAKLGGFVHDTGEGGISRYHREVGGDLIWEIGSGYFGCRNDDGSFCAERFAVQAQEPQVKMIEIKLSQGAKPGHGGVLPGAKVTAEIADARGVPIGVDCISPARHSAFKSPVEMMHFIARLRDLSGGKPVGFKLCIGHPWEFMAICKAMLETGIRPDFIVIDGSEGGTGAAPLEFVDHVGTPLREGLVLAHNCLVGAGPAAIHPPRGERTGGDRLRHRAPAGAGSRLVQCGARLHVRIGLHPGAGLSYRPLPDRRLDAESMAATRPRGRRQGHPGTPIPPKHARRAGRAGGRGRAGSPERPAADAHPQTNFAE